MNTLTKIVGVLAGASILMAFKVKKNFSAVIDKMTFNISNISNLRMRSGRAFLNLDITFHNNIDVDMTIWTAGQIKLKEIKLFYKGTLLGNTVTDITSFELPAKSNFIVRNIEVQLLLLNIINQMLNANTLDTNMNNYQVHVTVEALGKTWVIEK